MPICYFFLEYLFPVNHVPYDFGGKSVVHLIQALLLSFLTASTSDLLLVKDNKIASVLTICIVSGILLTILLFIPALYQDYFY